MLSHYRQYRKELAWIAHARKVGAEIDAFGEAVFSLPSKQDDEDSQTNLIRFNAKSRERDLLLESMLNDIPWYAKIVPVK